MKASLRPRAAFAALVLALPCASSCVVAAAAGVGAAVSQEFSENAKVAYLRVDLQQVREIARQVFQSMAMDPIQEDAKTGALTGVIQNARVLVRAEQHSFGEIKLSVSARRFGTEQGDLAADFIWRVRRSIQ